MLKDDNISFLPNIIVASTNLMDFFQSEIQNICLLHVGCKCMKINTYMHQTLHLQKKSIKSEIIFCCKLGKQNRSSVYMQGNIIGVYCEIKSEIRKFSGNTTS